MDALLFAMSFEVVLLQMKILEGSIELRLRNWQPTNKIQKLQYEKLRRDRDLVNHVIRKTIVEVVEVGKWNTIKQTICELKHKGYDIAALRLTNKQLKTCRAELLRELQVKKNQWATELREADRKVSFLRDKISDDLLNANTRLCYAEMWLFARFESLELKHEVPRPPKPDNEQEDRVHVELLRAYDQQTKEHEESVKYWQQRYETDTKVISAKIKEKCEELRVASEKRAELEKMYNLHEGEMRSWLTFKRERAARLAREEHQRMSAVRIQAWWRGIMVQKALGQFKYLRHIKKQPGKGKKK